MKLTFFVSAILILSVACYDINKCQNLPNVCQNWKLILPQGFQKVDKNCSDQVLLNFGKGGLCQCIVAKKIDGVKVQVYRAFDAPPTHNHLTSLSHKARQFGGYWSLDPIDHISAERYRREYAVCTEWNQLTYKIRCDLPQGSEVQLGFGQSVVSVCSDQNECYKQSKELQVVLDFATTGKMQQTQNQTCVTLNFNERFDKKGKGKKNGHFLLRN